MAPMCSLEIFLGIDIYRKIINKIHIGTHKGLEAEGSLVKPRPDG